MSVTKFPDRLYSNHYLNSGLTAMSAENYDIACKNDEFGFYGNDPTEWELIESVRGFYMSTWKPLQDNDNDDRYSHAAMIRQENGFTIELWDRSKIPDQY